MVDVVIKGGRIVSLGSGEIPKTKEVIDATGKHVWRCWLSQCHGDNRGPPGPG